MPRLFCANLMPNWWLLIMITSLCSPLVITTGAITTVPTGMTLTTKASTSTSHTSPSTIQPLQSKTRTYTSTTTQITIQLHGPQPQAVQTSAAKSAPAVGPWSTQTAAVTSSTNPTTPNRSTKGGHSSLEVTESGLQLASDSSEPATDLSASTSPAHLPKQSTSRATEAVSQPTDTVQPEPTLDTATTAQQSSITTRNATESNTTKSMSSTTVAIFTSGTTSSETATMPEVITTHETTANTSTPTNSSVSTHVPQHTTESTRSSSPEAHSSTDPSTRAKGKSSALTPEAEIAIIVVISAAAATILTVAVVCFLRRTRQAKQTRGYLTDADFVTSSVSIGDFTMHSIDLDD